MGLGVRPSEDKVARVERFGGLGRKTTGGRFPSLGLKTRGSVVETKATGGSFRRFGRQNPGGASEEAGMARGGILEVASRRRQLLAGSGVVHSKCGRYFPELGLQWLG